MRIAGQAAIAAVFGVSEVTVAQWQNAGMPVAVRGGPRVGNEYETADCIAWMLDRERRKLQGPESPKDRLARLQGDDLELKLATQRGKLIEAAAVEPAMRAAIVAARERIRDCPARIAEQIEGMDRTAREAALRELFDDVLDKLSRWSACDLEDGGLDEFAD